MSARASQPATITWLGHATALIELDGVRLLTDPVLRTRVGPLIRIAPEVDLGLVREVDCVLLSHLHADHADLGSLRVLGAHTPVIAPYPAARWLVQRGMRDVRDLRVGEATAVGGLQVSAVPAAHDGRRTPIGPSAEPVGYVISGSRSIYFAGDTDLFEGMAALRGRIDCALLPVAGWGPRLGPGHLDPERAADAAALIAPALAIPIHWGTLSRPWPARRPADPDRPAREFALLVKARAPAVVVRVLAPGARTAL